MKSKKLVLSIMLVALPATTIMAVALTAIGISKVRTAYLDSFSEGLKSAAIQLEDELSHEYDGDWSMTDDGTLLKGPDEVYPEYKEQMEDMHSRTGIEYTLFWGDTRHITTMVDSKTGQNMEGTKAGAGVVDIVLNKNQEYMATNFTIGDKKWYAYYIPLSNSDGSVVGMVFAGREAEDVNSNITSTTILMIIVTVIFLAVIFAMCLWIMHTSTLAITDIVEGLKNLSNGNLNFEFKSKTLARQDELGVIAECSNGLRDKLKEVITSTLDLSDKVTQSGEALSSSADTASNASNLVTDAIGDISKGAATQVDSVEDSVKNTNEMGINIDSITESIEMLTKAALEMKEASNNTVEALEKLMTQNQEVMESMGNIDHQIRLTNDAVKEIADASNVITDISSQTNLLALNASIEAARAGEAGKGFAVVATEIGSLADQSGQAAVSIKDIVNNLVTESQKSVDIIASLNEGLTAQNQQLNSTKDDMDGMVENVNSVEDGASMISDKVKQLNKYKENLGSIINELSSISSQNAESTQQTNASMQELNATFEIITNAATELKGLAEELNGQMKFFNL